MGIRVLVQMTAKDGRSDELAARLEARARSVSTETGCIQFEPFRSISDGNRFVIVELWANEDDLAAHAELTKLSDTTVIDELVSDEAQLREDYEFSRLR
jgi:quinol monooxygenase YgiN